MANFTLNFNKQANTSRLNLVQNQNNLQKAVNRLSTGKKFNAPGDGPASFSLLSSLSSTLQVGEQGVTNAKNGTSLLDTADAALANMEKIFTQVAVLAEDAANGVWTDDQRTVMDAQSKKLLEVADNIAQSTDFNGNKILTSAQGYSLTLQIGTTADAVDKIALKIDEARTKTLASADIELDTAANALTGLTNANNALAKIRERREKIGSAQQAIQFNISNRESMNQEIKNTISNIGDADVAVEMENYTNYMAKVQASQYMYMVAMQNPAKISQMIQSM